MNQMQEALLTAIRRSPNMSALDEFTAEYKTFKEENGMRKALPESLKQRAVNLIKGGIKRQSLAEKLGISQSAIIAWQKDVDGSSATVRRASKIENKAVPIQLATGTSITSNGMYTLEMEGVKLSGPKDRVKALINKILS